MNKIKLILALCVLSSYSSLAQTFTLSAPASTCVATAFTATIGYSGPALAVGTQLGIQISDSSGNFGLPLFQIYGTTTTATTTFPAQVSCSLPGQPLPSTGYKLRLVVGSNYTPMDTIGITLNGISVSVSPSPAIICAGSSPTLTATVYNGGTTPTYAWSKNGAAVTGATSATYTPATFATGDVYYCFVHDYGGNGTCTSVNFSRYDTLTIAPAVQPTISIANSTSGTICPTTPATLTATTTLAGSTPAYMWLKNGVSIGTSATYTDTFSSNDHITCTLASSLFCAAPVQSAVLTVPVTPVPATSVTVATATDTVCAGAQTTFVATGTGSGAAPAYQWMKNGVNIASATGSSYTTPALATNDTIMCKMLSNAACALNVNSNKLGMTVKPLVTPGVSVALNTSDTICANTQVTFTATPVNGGAAPAYVWLKNGAVITGATNAAYTLNTLANNDTIKSILISNATCAATPTDTSAKIVMTVKPVLTPGVSVALNTSDTICANTQVTFTATPINGGTAPAYVWLKNGAVITGATSAAYTANTLANSDIIKSILITNAACAASPSDTSAKIVMTVNPLVTPAVAFSATPGTSITKGTSVTFTAAPTNGGATPLYQWILNNVPVAGANATTYTNATLANLDSVNVLMVSNVQCASTDTVLSAAQIINVSTGVGNVNNTFITSVYPNPANDHFTISGTINDYHGGELVKLTLVDMTGRVIMTNAITAPGKNFTFQEKVPASISSGTYILNVNIGTDENIYKITVNK